MTSLRPGKRLLIVFLWILAIFSAVIFFTSRTETTGQAQIGGAFTLTDTHGKRVTDADFRGKVMLVFFGFTHCPDICPTTMAVMTNMLEALGPDAKRVAPVFITVDPERDTPEVMKAYLAHFHPGITGLTGTREEIQQAVEAYKVYASKRDIKPAASVHDAHAGHGAHGESNYMVDHSGFIYLMDTNGAYAAHFSQQDPMEKILAAVKGQLK